MAYTAHIHSFVVAKKEGLVLVVCDFPKSNKPKHTPILAGYAPSLRKMVRFVENEIVEAC